MSIHHRDRWLTVLLLACLFVVVPGCGSKFSSAEGHVSFAGAPIQDGTISFDPVDGQVASAGCAIQAGEYKIDRVLPGKKIVRITAQKKTGRKVPLSTIMPASMCPPGATTDEIVKYIPACYGEQSELTAEVTSGRNTFEFDLKPR